MSKKLLRNFGIPALAGALVAGGILASGVVPTFAASTTSDKGVLEENDKQGPGSHGSIYLGSEDESQKEDAVNDKEENAALKDKAKITKAEAVQYAQSIYPQSTILKAGLENENGYLVYEVLLKDQSKQNVEMKIDAGNGKVLAAEKGTEENEEYLNEAQDQENEADIQDEGQNAYDSDDVQEEIED